MSKTLSRRKTLKSLASAGAGAMLSPRLISGARHSSLHIAGRPVELSLTSISPQTLRLSIVAIENGKPAPIPLDGSLAQQTWPQPLARLTTFSAEQSLRCGTLRVRLSARPWTLRVEADDGRLVQQLRLDEESGELSFLTGDKPLLGFGEGGPQFDRRGAVYSNRNGQGG